MTVDYGVDVSTEPDLDFDKLVTDEDAVREAVLRSINDSREGICLTDILNGDFDDGTLGALSHTIKQAVILDERILDASVSLAMQDSALNVSIQVQIASGVFKMTLNVTELNVEVLS
jgi:hypothetical protein